MTDERAGRYLVEEHEFGGDAYGTTIFARGPGLSPNAYYNRLHLLQPLNDWAAKHYDPARERQNLVLLLNEAYEAGRESLKRELAALITPVKK